MGETARPSLVDIGVIARIAVASSLFCLIYHTSSFWLFTLAPSAIVLLPRWGEQKMHTRLIQIVFWSHAGIVCASLAGTFLVYTADSIGIAFSLSTATFLAAACYGFTAWRDLNSFVSFLLTGLVGVGVCAGINALLVSGQFQFAVLMIATFVFCGLTACDTQTLKEMFFANDRRGVSRMLFSGAQALLLDLDFVGLFLALVLLIGKRV